MGRSVLPTLSPPSCVVGVSGPFLGWSGTVRAGYPRGLRGTGAPVERRAARVRSSTLGVLLGDESPAVVSFRGLSEGKVFRGRFPRVYHRRGVTGVRQ